MRTERRELQGERLSRLSSPKRQVQTRVRRPGLLALPTDDRDLAFVERVEVSQHMGNERSEVLEAIGHSREDDDANLEARQVLLVRQVLVRSDQDVILNLCRLK